MALIGDLEHSGALLHIAGVWTFVLAIDFAISFSYTLVPRAADRRSLADLYQQPDPGPLLAVDRDVDERRYADDIDATRGHVPT